MKEPYREGVAIHSGPESCVVVRKDRGEALTGVRPGWALSREIADILRGADALAGSGRQQLARRYRETRGNLARLGRYAAANRRERGEGKPQTFNFLGFTHICAKTSRGGFTVLQQTMRTRWQAKLEEVKGELKRRMHFPVPEVGSYLRSVVLGHIRYYGVPMNCETIRAFRWAVGRLW